MSSDFIPAWWLPSPHLQTLWPFLFRRRLRLNLNYEQLELDDGDFLDLCWSQRRQGKLVLLIHGLEGSIKSHYATGMFSALEANGYRPVFMHFRGCGGNVNRLARAYHSGDTDDIASVVEHIGLVTGSPVFAAIGFSLGANALLKWLGETGKANSLTKAIGLSTPFRLIDASNRMEQGFSRLYRDHLLKRLCSVYSRKVDLMQLPIDVDMSKIKSLRDYDELITAPLHGFTGADDYYSQSSSRPYLKEIGIETLIIHAKDDPFMYPDTVPDDEELSDQVELALSDKGGHIGFVSGKIPFRPVYWHEEKVISFLND